MRRASLATLAAAATLLASCGGSTSTPTPVSVTHSYLASIASGDGSTACSLLTPGVKQQLQSAAAALFKQDSSQGCAAIVRAAHRLLDAEQAAELRKAILTLISQKGNHATVRMTLQNAHIVFIPLEKSGTGWLVTVEPGIVVAPARAG
jgi:hypothetical protein